MQYELRVMSFDGDYITDTEGSLEDCQLASENMGSKWYFYPWHVITTPKGTIKECYGGLVSTKNGICLLGSMFNGRKFKTLQDTFYRASVLAEGLELDTLDYENFIFHNIK